MLVRFSTATWERIVHEVHLADGLLNSSTMQPHDYMEYLSEQAVEIDFNAMKQVV